MRAFVRACARSGCCILVSRQIKKEKNKEMFIHVLTSYCKCSAGCTQTDRQTDGQTSVDAVYDFFLSGLGQTISSAWGQILVTIRKVLEKQNAWKKKQDKNDLSI